MDAATAPRASMLRLCPGLTVLAIVSLLARAATAEFGASVSTTDMWACPPWDPLMSPTHEVFRGQDVVRQIPPHPKAVMFVAHGAGKDAFAFFGRGQNCSRCYGLPEDRKAVLDALERGYAVIALKSIGEAWEELPLDTTRDLDIAISLIDEWTRAHSLEHLPRIAWGHSSGGMFVSALSLRIPFRALVVMCSHPQLELLESASPDQFPPIFFAHMARDVDNVARVENWMSLLSAAGVPVAEKRCGLKYLTPHFFAERIPCLRNVTSEKVYGAYKAEALLDSSGYLLMNPLLFDWMFPLQKWKVLLYCTDVEFPCLPPLILEELQVAYGDHSFTSEANDEIFPWLENRLSEKSTGVAEF